MFIKWCYAEVSLSEVKIVCVCHHLLLEIEALFEVIHLILIKNNEKVMNIMLGRRLTWFFAPQNV